VRDDARCRRIRRGPRRARPRPLRRLDRRQILARGREDLLKRIYGIYRRSHPPLPDGAADASELLAHREFLADPAKEIIQDALRAHRLADPPRYEDRARAKVAPPARIGKGLARAVRATVADAASGALARPLAAERLRRQLAAFACTDEAVERLISGGAAGLDETLASLEPARNDAPLGDEHLRVQQDLYGGDLAAMQRELFGGAGGRGKLVYRRNAASPALPIRIAVSKRKAHAVIGYCEGVCTAPDHQLWDDPRFLQAIIWGPEGRACGGVHLLLVEHEGRTHLALPGINPALSLIAEAGEDAVLDAVFAFAQRLVQAWGLGELWIPTDRGIASNRGPIHAALAERPFAKRRIPSTRFSYAPYAYSFDEVLIVTGRMSG
jgi:hypothetical protein